MTKVLGDILIKVVFSLIEAFANKLIIKGCELDMSSGLGYQIIVVHRTMTMGIFRAQIYCNKTKFSVKIADITVPS